MESILIFIPMYNCEKQIPRVIEGIAALGEDQRLFAEVLVVDNGSADGSVAAASAAIQGLSIPARVVKNRENYSLGGSHKVAFSRALEGGFDYVAVLHGDDQGSIADLAPQLKSGAFRQYDSLLGARFHRESRLVGYSKFRIFGNHVFNLLLTLCARRRILDLGSGLNLYRTDYLRNRFYLPFPNNLTFNVYLLLYGVYARSSFAFFPLTWREEDQVSNAKLWAQSREILRLALRFALGRGRVFAGGDNQYSAIDYRCDVIADNGRER